MYRSGTRSGDRSNRRVPWSVTDRIDIQSATELGGPDVEAVRPADAAGTLGPPGPAGFFTPGRVAKIVALAIPFLWLFHGTLYRLLRVWLEVPDWSHGLLIPLFALGIFLYIHEQWRDVPLRPTYTGLAVVFVALLANVMAVWWLKKLIMLEDYSWWLLLVGLVVTVCGWRFARAVWFPLVFICFSIRIGGVLYNLVSAKLQQTAAVCATGLLKLVGIQVDLEGVVIDVMSRSNVKWPVTVAEACSGMRILMAFLALGTLIAYVVRRPWWHRLVLVLGIIPIAIVSNVLRVTAMGVLYYLDRESWAKGLAHTLEGMLMLPVAFLLFWLLHVLLCKLVIEEHGPAETAPPRDDGQGAARPAPVLGAISKDLRAAWTRPAGVASHWPGIWRSLNEPHFRTLAIILFVAAISWNALAGWMGVVFSKKPVPLRQMLDAFPRKVDAQSESGSCWQAVSRPPGEGPAETRGSELIPEDTEHTLGASNPYRLRKGTGWDPAKPDSLALRQTPQYIQRIYTRMTAAGKEEPGRLASFFISYYTGTPDPVPHVPERCFLGAGWASVKSVDQSLLVAGQKVPVRFSQFAKGDHVTTVAYLLCFNGQIESDHNKVRVLLNSPFGHYSYFSKIEISFQNLQKLDDIIQATTELLGDFLPIYQSQFLADWNDYKDKK